MEIAKCGQAAGYKVKRWTIAGAFRLSVDSIDSRRCERAGLLDSSVEIAPPLKSSGAVVRLVQLSTIVRRFGHIEGDDQ
jgi:hypothetical protein